MFSTKNIIIIIIIIMIIIFIEGAQLAKAVFSGALINPINKPATNNRRLLMAAVFHFLHSLEKDS